MGDMGDMGDLTQQEVWQKHAEAEDVTPERLSRPAQFQVELARLLDLLLPVAGGSCAEAGSELGVTSYLLERPQKRVIIDYNMTALEKAKKLWVDATPHAEACCVDLFDLDISLLAKFDLVFNAGVIEHYSFDDRVRLIKAMRALVKPGNPVVIAFPNHYSIAYRAVYLLRTVLGIWRFPKEAKLYDLQQECLEAGGCQIIRFVLADSSVCSWSDPWYLRWLKAGFYLLNRLSKLEGYLTVCVIR